MLRVPAKARVLMVAVFGVGLASVALAAAEGGLSSLTTLALFATAVVLTELFQVEHDESSLDPLDAHISSFSTGVHFATVVVLGPWAAALVAALGVVAVDPLKGRAWSKVGFNASVFALAALAGGGAFELAGGQPGSLGLPGDFLPVVALVLAYNAVNTLLVGSMIGFFAGSSPWSVTLSSFRAELPSTAAQGGLGVLLALCALEQPWATAALVPLLVAVYHAHARLALLRRETARALETFANVVDERDPYTYRHSARVAQHVRSLAEALDLPPAVVARLHWAGRLHDLGKIAVDAAVLRKPAALAPDEWATLRRHPRLSARLLQRFRFASDEARAVEYHHERYDGRGYYAIDRSSIPLAAHFLIVADSYDAMRSDRPYRAGMSRERALAEIEAGSGTQFHPTVAKTFVALERGQDPLAALTREERAELRRLSFGAARRRSLRRVLESRPELATLCALSAGLFAFGLGSARLGAAGFAVAAAGIAWARIDAFRAGRVAGALRSALARDGGADKAFDDLASALAGASTLRWAAIVSWRENELDGTVAAEWGSRAEAPNDTALTSWLVRETESADDLVVGADRELGLPGACAALALRQGESVTGFLVLAFARGVPGHVEAALRRCAADLSDALVESGEEPPFRRRRLAAVS
jgi:HD-GYP domain-containing protein (c-di-GMP phosphodiesterase class II)